MLEGETGVSVFGLTHITDYSDTFSDEERYI